MLSVERWLEVKRIASEALELPIASRTDFVAGRCPGALRRDVELLLHSCDRVSSTTTFLDTPASEFAARVVATVEQNPINVVPLQAELAGRYTIERELGRGGMATVYLAYDERHRRPVALKVVYSSPEPIVGSSAARFKREIEIAARLTHPHILPLYDSGAAAECLYYVMPFVSGESLRDRIARSGPLSLREALRLLRDVARALACAHREGIVHRDIKPGNVLLNHDGDALVADFGVASALAAASIGGVPDTASADLAFGTPAYSAPEQLRGDPDTDQRADLYSFGVMAYEMVCGARPSMRGPTPQLPDVRRTVLESLTTQRPDVPPALAAMIQRLLSPDPVDRPQDAGEVLRFLDAMMMDRMTTNVAPAKPRVRRRIVVLRSVTSLVLVGIVALVVPHVRSSARAATRVSANPDAEQAFERGTALAGDLRPETLKSALALFEEAIQLDSTLARAWAGLANVYTYQALFTDEPRDDVITKSRQALKRALSLDPNLVEAHTVRAHQLFVLECRRDDAEREFERTLALDSTYAPARGLYGWFLHATHRDSLALVHLRRARNLNAVFPGAETLLGRVFVNMNQPDSAIHYLQKTLDYKSEHAMAYEQLALALLEKHDSAQAIAVMRRAAALDGRDSAQLAYVYAKTGKRAEALRIVQRLVKTELQRKLPVAGMAMAYGALGKPNEAFRMLERSSCLIGLGVSAGYESLRSDWRFAGLLQRKGLEASVQARDGSVR